MLFVGWSWGFKWFEAEIFAFLFVWEMVFVEFKGKIQLKWLNFLFFVGGFEVLNALMLNFFFLIFEFLRKGEKFKMR